MDKYKIIKEIGKGNYGKAYLVRNLNDKNLYVIKSIDKSSFNEEQLNNALYEVNVIKSLQNPYIIKYIESFYEKSYLCIVMEYADCGDMNKLIKSQQKLGIYLKEEIILNWFVQLCFAVKYIHEKKILHRDLKASNIFLCSNGDIKLGDFGISKMLNNTDEYAKTLIGTPYYLSPEICLKKPYNQKSDIWSLGCILYELMNLKHAFEADNIGELILKILKGKFGQMKNNFTNDLNNMIKEILITNNEKRPTINMILEKHFLMRYIKMNYIKQLGNKEKSIGPQKKKIIEQDDSVSSNIIISNPMTQSKESRDQWIKEKEDKLIEKDIKSDHSKDNKEDFKQIIKNLKEDNMTLQENRKKKLINPIHNPVIMNNQTFITPDYGWYKTEKELIVVMEISDQIKDLKCIVKVIEGNYYFKISGAKVFQITNNPNVLCFFNNRKEGKFQIEFIIPIKDLQLKEKKCHKFTHENGVYVLYFLLNTESDEQHFDL